MCSVLLFFFNDPATTEIYTDVHTLSLHDALPISEDQVFEHLAMKDRQVRTQVQADFRIAGDRLDGFPEICLQLMRGPHFAQRQVFRSEEHTSELQSLMRISYAVFCLKKKKHTEEKHDSNKYST